MAAPTPRKPSPPKARPDASHAAVAAVAPCGTAAAAAVNVKPAPQPRAATAAAEEVHPRAAASARLVRQLPAATNRLEAAPPPTAGPSSLPTYQSSEQSRYYEVAKLLLNDGDFETALSTIEEGIAWTRSQLLLQPKMAAAAATGGEEEDEDDLATTLHESMAPFHYLYGTTLLYSIEESTDGLQPLTDTGAVIEVSGGGGGEEEGGGGGDEPLQPDAGADGAADEEGEDEAPVDDMEIAWENLDTARTILEQMLASGKNASDDDHNNSNTNNDKLRADLAQVLLREGDLQRQNGALEAAAADYAACLAHRQDNATIAPYSRKIADVHCNLGAVYFNMVVEHRTPPLAEEEVGGGSSTDGGVAAAADFQAKLAFCRRRGFYHYYECAKTLGGIAAELAGVDPTDLLRQAEQIPHWKSTGEDDNDDETDREQHQHPKVLSLQLSHLRTLVQSLTLPAPDDETAGVVVAAEVADCRALLNEIQETLDEAEASELGVAQATAMKDEITALVAAQGGSVSGGGGTVDSGSRAAATCTTIGFGSAAAASTAAAVQPVLMIVKKKKKRDAGDLTLRPASEPAKRAKSSE